MRKHILYVLAASSFCFAACTVEEDNDDIAEVYSKEFVNQFGDIDKNQDWNLATRGSVTVTVGEPTEVKVYTRCRSKWWLTGRYQQVSGTQTLQFDIVAGTSAIKVKADGKTVETTSGASVDFNSLTRTVHTGTTDEVTVAQADNYKMFVREADNKADYYNKNSKSSSRLKYGELYYESLFPDSTDNSSNSGLTLVGSGSTNVKSFELYPVGWTSSATLTVGIAYTKNNSIVTVPIYTTKESSANQGLDYSVDYTRSTNWYNGWQSTLGVTASSVKYSSCGLSNLSDAQIQTLVDYEYNNNSNYREIVDAGKGWLGVSAYQNNAIALFSPWAAVSTSGAYTLHTYSDTYNSPDQGKCRTLWRSRGIKVTLPQSFSGCFYISDGSTTKYSNSSFTNGSAKLAAYGTIEDGYREDSYGYNITQLQGTYLGFEWDGDNDLNDVLFLVDNVEDDTEEEPLAFILAAEDLGSTGDFDFNDVVFSVKHVSGETTATVTPLAAGGTLPSYIYYNGTQVGQEIHKWLGVDDTETMINTTEITKSGDPMTISVPSDFSMAYNSSASGGSMGGFSIHVTRSDGTQTTVEAPGKGKAPQMICVPVGWLWPLETCNIAKAYPKFGDYGANYGSNNDWYNAPVTGYCIKRN